MISEEIGFQGARTPGIPQVKAELPPAIGSPLTYKFKYIVRIVQFTTPFWPFLPVCWGTA